MTTVSMKQTPARPFRSAALLLAIAAAGLIAANLRGLSGAAQTRTAPTSGLRILVVEGEDAVNIVEQKTAVAPIVEVRDRNDQPVAGAVVRFAIRGGRATFGGPRTLTLTTNAAGRAAVTTLTPTGSGVVQISATAAFQGQTAAVTIAQTNVMSAAAASGAGASGGAAGAGGAAGSSGGGLSVTTVAIAGGAAAGGAVVAQEFLGFSTYETDIAGDVVESVPRGNGVPCSRTAHWTGHLLLHFKGDSDISGDAHIHKGALVGTADTCPNSPSVGGTSTWGFRSPDIQGTTTAIKFHSLDSGSWGENDYDFVGALNGDTVTGTLTISTTNIPQNGGAAAVGSGVMSVTLPKTQ